ncbi:hypothetical protein [Rosistilla oblonga]|uniref:THUMP-like domain-containing protein n=1 Tax=Rosistilla oblonga TaxID=2527990 RepID=A0A518IWG1_9BACT|nr:hypothetical protein [Rosistilla oblonga]QDV57438.1 hypothetical protein Mal33_34480 [Rosistilla oblonga]
MPSSHDLPASGDPDPQVIPWLSSPEALEAIDRAEAAGQATVARTAALRRKIGPDRAAAVLSAAAARGKAIDKWGTGPWLVTDRGIQQATDRAIARYKSRRVPAGLEIFDWCCGVGGEAMQLSDRGPLTAIDRDPKIAEMARHNLGVHREQQAASDVAGWEFRSTVICDDVFAHHPPAAAWLNLDPDRRSESNTAGTSRATHCDYLQPPLSDWLPVAKQVAGASIKLAPATQLPEECHELGEREWISHRGSCRQQVLWLGEASPPGTIRATVVTGDDSATSFAVDQPQLCDETDTCEAFAFDLDPAVRAAGLSESYAAAKGLRALGGPAGFFTAQQNDVDALAQPFEVLWHGVADMKKLRQAIAAIDGCVSEVKIRGLDWKPPTIIKKLGRREGKKLTLLASRIGSYCGAILAVRP